MGVTANRIGYFLSSLGMNLLRMGRSCPSCGCKRAEIVARKYLVTTLRRCAECRLMFRAPVQSSGRNSKFYQGAYQSGMTTEMPRPDALAQWRQNRFLGTEKDFSRYITLLRALLESPGAIRILDFGCSWGYGSWQFQQAGYDVQGFEVSRARAEFARTQMGVQVVSNMEELRGPFDAFFSSHVLEHIPAAGDVLKRVRQLVKPGGWFVAVVPNGSRQYQVGHEEAWMRSWGLVHPVLMDEEFVCKAFTEESLFLAGRVDCAAEVSQWLREGCPKRMLSLDGPELVVIARVK